MVDCRTVCMGCLLHKRGTDLLLWPVTAFQPSLPGPQYVAVVLTPSFGTGASCAARGYCYVQHGPANSSGSTFGADVAKLNPRYFSLSTTHTLTFRSSTQLQAVSSKTWPTTTADRAAEGTIPGRDDTGVSKAASLSSHCATPGLLCPEHSLTRMHVMREHLSFRH